MAEYEPVTSRQEFLTKWLKIAKSGTQISVDHLYQLSLDVFASRRGENWRDCDLFIDDQEKLSHPDGRHIFITFDKREDYPLSPRVTFFLNQEAADDYEYAKGYEIRKTAGGIRIFEEMPEPEGVREILFDPPTCKLYREILQAHVNTPQAGNPL